MRDGFWLILLLAAAHPALAHHNFAAEFDQKRPICLKGVISRLDWFNPHIYIYIDVTGESGRVVTWTLESGSPQALSRTGWTRETFKVGDRVAIGGFVAKRGENRGSAQQVRPLKKQMPAASDPAASERPSLEGLNKKEAERLLTNSPWAHTVSLPLMLDPQPWREESRRGGAYAGERPNGVEEILSKSQTFWVTVRWHSALPIQQALLLDRGQENASILPFSRMPFESGGSHYWIAVTGVPCIADTYGPGRFERALLAEAELVSRGRAPVRASDVNVDPVGTNLDIVFRFPRTAVWSPDDGDVEFSMPFGKSRLKQKFHLKDMIYRGGPAL